MGFLSPLMLFGAAAVSVPIVLHLFFRSRYRTVPWAAMKFLLTSIEQTSRRLKFQELLLLFLRCLILATLALAMARPILSAARGTGRGDAVDAVFVMDVSYSMSAADGAKSRLERAKTAALEILEELPPHSTVQIIASSDRADLLGPRSPSNLDQGKLLIQNLELTSLATDFAPSITEAHGVLDRGQLPNKELYFFSDMQKSGFEQQTSSLITELKDLKGKAGLFFVRCGTRSPKNAAIVGITPQAGVPRPGERIGFAVLVRNTGTEDLTDLDITLTGDTSGKSDDKERTVSQSIPSLKAGETRAVALSARFDRAGPRVLTARIKHDDLPGDNRFDQIIPVRDTVNVLIVNGGSDREAKNSATYYLNHALLPIRDTEQPKYFLQLKEVEPRLASPALLAKSDLVFLVNAAAASDKLVEGVGRRSVLPADFVTELGAWVRNGHGLVIIPGENVQPDAYNRALGSLLPMPIARVFTPDAKKPLHLDRATFTLPAFLKFKEDAYFTGFNDIETRKSLELKEAKSDTVNAALGEAILRYDNGAPAVAQKKFDAGEVILMTSAANPEWSDWPVTFQFIPFIQTLFAHLLQEQTQNLNVVAGQAMTWYPHEKELRNFSLITPGNEQLRLGLPTIKDKRQVLALPQMTRAGIYRLVPRMTTLEQSAIDAGVPIAVIPDLRESQDLETLTAEQIDGRLGFSPVHLTAGGDMPGSNGFDRFQKEWTLWILLLVLVLTVGESFLAWLCGRSW